MPRLGLEDDEFYYRTMVALFTPCGWRRLDDLALPSECWQDVFKRTAFKAEHKEIMENLNLLYECLDARDDYKSQRREQQDMLPTSIIHEYRERASAEQITIQTVLDELSTTEPQFKNGWATEITEKDSKK